MEVVLRLTLMLTFWLFLPIPNLHADNDLDLNAASSSLKTYKVVARTPGGTSILEPSPQILRNCFYYSTCNKIDESFGPSGPVSSLQFKVKLTLEEFNSALQCSSLLRDDPRIDIQLFEMDPLSKTASLINWGSSTPYIASATPSNFYTKSKVNSSAFIKTEPLVGKMWIAEAQKLLEAGKNFDAINLLVFAFAIDFHGFKVAPGGPKSMSITDHYARTISIGAAFLENACSLFRALRHESEHVGQFLWAEACNRATKKPQHSFNNHLYREINAYLNDAYYAQKFCENTQHRTAELNSLQSSYEEYIYKIFKRTDLEKN